VSELGPVSVLAVFVVFCRIGACLMLMPGFSSARIPVQVRLLVAFAVTLALVPLLLDPTRAAIGDAAPVTILRLIGAETLTGSLIGLLARIFFLALQFTGVAIASYVGFTVLPGVPVDEPDPMPALVSLITMGATMLFFVTDQHWELFRALASSYAAWPAGSAFDIQWGMVQITDQLYDAFILALRISGPFLIYTVTINLAVGLINKMTPQIPVYFISLPFAIAGGLILLYFTIGDFLRLYIHEFASWLAAG